MTSKEQTAKGVAPPATSSSSSSSSRVPSPWHGRRLSSSASNSPGAAGTPTGSALSMTPSPHLRATRAPSSIVNGDMSRLGSSSSPRSFSPIHPEPDKRGNLEYKLRILPVTAGRFSRLVTQLKWRLAEGNGLAVYEIGVLDDGTLIGLPKEEMKNSLTQLAMMGRALGASCEIRRCIVVQRGQVAAGDDLEGPTTADAQLHTFRHRKAYSSKTQSAGLDNIVGLTSLNNEDAAKLLETAQGTSSAWSLDITTSDSETEGEDDEEDDHRGQPSHNGDRPLSETESDDSDDDGEEEDEDGFAFSLSLDDNEDETMPLPALTRRASRPPVSNSPWKLSTPDCSPSGSRHSLPAHQAQQVKSNNGGPPARPTSLPSVHTVPPTPANATRDDDAEAEDEHHFSELAGMDVKGVLQFALDPDLPAIGLNTKKKKKSGRRKREERQHNMAMLVSSGQHPHPPSQNGSGPDTDPLAPIKASGFTAEEVSNLSYPKVRRGMKTSKRFSREPRAERRARRLAELKAQEREGEGLLIALEADPALSDQERFQWWKYSGLTFENHVPHWDSTRHGWVREVADFLTVKEMMTLAESWDPRAPFREGDDAVDGDEQSPPPSPPPLPPGGRKTGQTIQQYLDASAASSLQSALSRKANCRRRRKERRRAAAAEHDGGALPGTYTSRGDGRSPRPTFLPPPSNGVAIPSRKPPSSVAGMATGSHPLSTSQTISSDDDDEDVDEEEDNFSMGLTMNIDDEGRERSKAATGSTNRSQHLSLSPVSVASSSTATTTTIVNGCSPGVAATTAARNDILQDPEVRIIVEAVLSLDSTRDSVAVPVAVRPKTPPTDGKMTAGDDGDTHSPAEEPEGNEDDSDADSDFGVWEL